MVIIKLIYKNNKKNYIKKDKEKNENNNINKKNVK